MVLASNKGNSCKKCRINLKKNLKNPNILNQQLKKYKKILVEKIIVNENLPMFQKDSLISCEEFVETIFSFTKIETISFEDFFKKPIEI